MRYLLTFSYDGTKFHGYQRQKNVKNIQSTIEHALSKILKTDIVIKASGRTDAFVHALGQTAHFDYDKKIPKNLKEDLNKEFNQEIIIKNIKKVTNDFHARFNVKEKTYRYIINRNKNKPLDGYAVTLYGPLDIKKMKETSKLFLGVHDFRNFVSGKRDDYTTIIYKINIKEKNDLLTIEFVGAGFYRYMVRHLVGALCDVGKGKVTIDVIYDMLLKPEVEKQLTVMPPEGLYLVKVKY